MFYDAFAQDIFLGHFPCNCFFCPGPAYVGIGPAPFRLALTGGPLRPNTPVFSGPSPLPSFFGVDPNMRTPYVQNFNLNIQQAIGGKADGASGLRWHEGHQTLPLPRYQSAQPGANHRLPVRRLPACSTTPNCPIGGFDSGSATFPHRLPEFLLHQSGGVEGQFDVSRPATSLRVMPGMGFHPRSTSSGRIRLTMLATVEDFIPNAAQPHNSLNPQAEKGNSNFDLRRRFSWNFVYEFPKWVGLVH